MLSITSIPPGGTASKINTQFHRPDGGSGRRAFDRQISRSGGEVVPSGGGGNIESARQPAVMCR
jgi:hypothetical protein